MLICSYIEAFLNIVASFYEVLNLLDGLFILLWLYSLYNITSYSKQSSISSIFNIRLKRKGRCFFTAYPDCDCIVIILSIMMNINILPLPLIYTISYIRIWRTFICILEYIVYCLSALILEREISITMKKGRGIRRRMMMMMMNSYGCIVLPSCCYF